MDNEKILKIARETLITHATDDELISFAKTLFTATIEEHLERINIHASATQTLSMIKSAVRAGVDDAQLCKIVRKLIEVN